MVLAVLFSASLGFSAFTVVESESTAAYTQQSNSLTLLSPVGFSATLSGSFSGSLDWSSVEGVFLEAAIEGSNPGILFSLELYGWDGMGFELINTYEGSTAGLGSSFSLIELQLTIPGSGDFSAFRGLQFTSNSPPEQNGGLKLRSVVASADPIVPVVTSSLYSNGQFSMSWSGTDALPVNIQRRESLVSGVWITVAQGIANGQYIDSTPPSGQAFYRVVVP